MNISAHKTVSFKAITSSSKYDFMKEIKKLKKVGSFAEADAATRALKKLSSRSNDYTIVYCDDIILLKSRTPKFRSKEIAKSFFVNESLSAFLEKASQHISKERLRHLRKAKRQKFLRSCSANFVNFCSKIVSRYKK